MYEQPAAVDLQEGDAWNSRGNLLRLVQPIHYAFGCRQRKCTQEVLRVFEFRPSLLSLLDLSHRLLEVDRREQGRDAARKHDVEGHDEQVAGLVVLAGHDAGDQGDGDDGEAYDLEELFVGEAVATGDGLEKKNSEKPQKEGVTDKNRNGEKFEGNYSKSIHFRGGMQHQHHKTNQPTQEIKPRDLTDRWFRRQWRRRRVRLLGLLYNILLYSAVQQFPFEDIHTYFIFK